MEQKPVDGHEALAPPDAEIAQQYLHEATAVADRRAKVVDRRALAWLQIINAVTTAAYLVALSAALRGDDTVAPQMFVFSFLVWTQVASGLAQRSGMQWRMTRSRWPVILAAGVLIAVVLVVFGFVALDPGVSPLWILVPAVMVLIGFGGYGVVQLARASADPRPAASARAPLPRGVRWGTVLIGVALGVTVMLAAAPEGALTTVFVLLVMLMLIAWMIAHRSDMGLPAVGAAWRWPHFVAFGASVGVLAVVVLGAGLPPALGVAGGAGVILLFAVVSFIPGRDLRD